MNILEIKNFSKTYKGNKKAVDNLSITVEAGDILWLYWAQWCR